MTALRLSRARHRSMQSLRSSGSVNVGRSRGQSGMALIAVLAAVAFASLVIAGLVGLMVTTMRVTGAQEKAARERRAADGAIEVAVERMRSDPRMAGEYCRGLTGTPYLEGLNFDQGTSRTGDDVAIDVLCDSEGGAESGTDQVRVLGAQPYAGPAIAAIGAIPGATPAPLPADTALVHSGGRPLWFSSGVTVGSGAVPAMTDPTARPAMRVGGAYTQGSSGYASPIAGIDCGSLGLPTRWQIEASTLACGSEHARDLAVLPPQDPDEPDNVIAPVDLPACTDPVVTFQPGKYDAVATAELSKLTSGANGCASRTFHFAPGIYSIDGTLSLGDAQSYYVFGARLDDGGTGGVQASSSASRANAKLCDSTVTGSTIVLTATASIQHTNGRVAICPARRGSGDAFPAIVQRPTVPFSISVEVPGAATLNFTCAPAFPPCDKTVSTANLPIAANGSTPISKAMVYFDGDEDANVQNNVVRNRRANVVIYNGGTKFCETGFHSGLPNSDLQTRFDLLRGTCANELTGRPVGSLNGMTMQIQGQASIQPGLVGQTLWITDVEIEVNELSGTAPGTEFSSTTWTGIDRLETADDNTADPIGCTDFICAIPNTNRRTDNMFVHEFNVGRFRFPQVEAIVAAGQDPTLTSLRANMKVKLKGALPNWTMYSGVLAGRHPENFRPRMATKVTLRSGSSECTVAAGLDNSIPNRRSTGGINSDQELSFDMNDPSTATGDCAGVMDAVKKLEPVGASVRFEMPCAYLNPGEATCWRIDQMSWNFFAAGPRADHIQFRPPSIDSFSLSVGTDIYTGAPANSSIRINAVDGPAASSFNVYGKTWMPKVNLDVEWAGGVTVEPVFADDLVVNGFGSRMAAGAEMGLVCCSPPEARTVNLTATVAGDRSAERLVARVEISDVDDTVTPPVFSRGHKVDVLRWLNCVGTGGCAAALRDSDIGPGDPPAEAPDGG